MATENQILMAADLYLVCSTLAQLHDDIPLEKKDRQAVERVLNALNDMPDFLAMTQNGGMTEDELTSALRSGGYMVERGRAIVREAEETQEVQ